MGAEWVRALWRVRPALTLQVRGKAKEAAQQKNAAKAAANKKGESQVKHREKALTHTCPICRIQVRARPPARWLAPGGHRAGVRRQCG